MTLFKSKNEEVEQIAEITKGLAGDYVRAADDSISSMKKVQKQIKDRENSTMKPTKAGRELYNNLEKK